MPENILVDKPQDQSSRWSGAFQGNVDQWVVLRLESLAVLSKFLSICLYIRGLTLEPCKKP